MRSAEGTGDGGYALKELGNDRVYERSAAAILR